MEAAEYARLDHVEDEMWWFRALHANLALALRQTVAEGGVVLDAGCGTGGLLRHLRGALAGRRLMGLDAYPAAAARAAAKARVPTVVGSVTALPFPDATFDGVVSADVMCHRQVEPAAMLREMRRVLRPGAPLVLNLPAYGWLLSTHDRQVHNVRRFTMGTLRPLLDAAGLRLARASYWNTVLFPLMVAHRLAAGGGGEQSDVHRFPPWVDRAFGAATAAERAALRAGLRLPFGGSLLVVARCPAV